jgi:colanic acid/amylovoran biosynthesis glycosyltransferase
MNLIFSQAMATGMPIVTTDHSGFPDQVLDGKNGAVAPEGDFEALAEKILFLMEHPELWPELGRFGRAHVIENYESKKLIILQVKYYLELLSRKQRDSSAHKLDKTFTIKRSEAHDHDHSKIINMVFQHEGI